MATVNTVTVSAKGWIVIPKKIRERHGIKPGDRVHVIDYEGIAVVPALKDAIKEGLGMFAGEPSLTEALLEERRRDLQREEAEIERWGKKRGKRKSA